MAENDLNDFSFEDTPSRKQTRQSKRGTKTVNYNEEDDDDTYHTPKRGRRGQAYHSDGDSGDDFSVGSTNYVDPALTPKNLPDNFYTISNGTAWPELQTLEPNQEDPHSLQDDAISKIGLNSRNGKSIVFENDAALVDSPNSQKEESLESDLVIEDADFDGLTAEWMNKPN